MHSTATGFSRRRFCVNPKGRDRARRDRERGLALLVTITLTAFLVLLLVALATLVRVEVAVANQQLHQIQARQNALMALNVAVGQLQRYAGRDDRVSATASLTGASVANPVFTGVWDANTTDGTALVWLVSGNEQAPVNVNPNTDFDRTADDAETPLVNVAQPGRVRLVGPGSARTAAEIARRLEHGAVVVPAVALIAQDPGMGNAPVTVGRMAYWVGDEGVKASLGLPDRAAEVTYAPWDTPAKRARLRQELGTTPSYVRDAAASSGLSWVQPEGFEALAVAGFARPPLTGIVTREQLALLPPTVATRPMDAFLADRFHDFTDNASAVLANTRGASDPYRGLQVDLSRNPAALGAAFERWADYRSYMEAPGTTTAGAPAAIPAITSEDSPRRRYTLQTPVTEAPLGLPELGFSVAPVLSNFILQFQARRVSATNANIQVRSRIFVTLWNPYSAALVPPDNLRLEIDGQPTITLTDPVAGVSANVNLATTSPVATGLELPFGAAFRYSTSLSLNYGAAGEMASWLPGRVYSWTTNSGAGATARLGFYNNSTGVTGWTHTGLPTLAGSAVGLDVDIPETTLTVRLMLGNEVISTYTARYDADALPDSMAGGIGGWCFAFGFRINQPRDYDADRSWLTLTDPRTGGFEQNNPGDAEVLIPFNTRTTTSPLPSFYTGTIATTDGSANSNINGHLIHRVQGSNPRAMSTYNDVSLFELPRAPLLSVGALQHLRVVGERPWGIGNPWGGTANQVFDRFFFSGLAQTALGDTAPQLEAGEPLPNWNLQPLASVTLDEVLNAPNGEASRHLVQAGAFNLNSTSEVAWRAFLSRGRFGEDAPFTYAEIANTDNSDPNAGTQADTMVRQETFLADNSIGVRPAPVFFRFPQSAQEVFFWRDPMTSVGGNARKFQVPAFRLGVRGYNGADFFPGSPGTYTPQEDGARAGHAIQHVTTDQVEIVAQEIVKRLRTRAATRGPFRNLEQFLSETDVFAGQSLLEAAIAASALNPAEVAPVLAASAPEHSGLSTLTLTQADLMNSAAPFLRTRSDTFRVRTYGEVINPATNQPEGRAWAEAIVQRLPDTVDPADTITQPSGEFGRRYQIIKFRWLNAEEI